jgi:tRNA (mo5U34)-methyltransferase
VKFHNDLRLFPRAKLIELARKQEWVHAIDLGDGYTTPGRWGTGNPNILEVFDQIDFQGKKVLDIGCWDGLHSFLAEERGAAEVYSTDLIDQRDFVQCPTYQIAHAALNSNAEYFPDVSVYDVSRLGVKDFDIALYTGIYYHLKDPLQALACLRQVMKDGGVIVIEGAVLPDSGCFARFYYRDAYLGDRSNWWIPTVECLQQWVECSFFRIVRQLDTIVLGESTRCTLMAEAVRGPDPLYIRPPEGLEHFQLP